MTERSGAVPHGDAKEKAAAAWQYRAGRSFFYGKVMDEGLFPKEPGNP